MTPPGYNENRGEWDEWRNLVLHEQKRTSNAIDAQSREISDIRAELSRMKGAASAWGALAGFVSAIGIAIIGALTGRQ